MSAEKQPSQNAIKTSQEPEHSDGQVLPEDQRVTGPRESRGVPALVGQGLHQPSHHPREGAGQVVERV